MLSALLPISVGGIGVREGVAVMLLAQVGVAAPQAALVATLGWLLTQPPALVGGLLSLAPRDGRALVPRRRSPRPHGGGHAGQAPLEVPLRGRAQVERGVEAALAYISSPGSLAAPPR